jgi:hypothetical protein
MKKPSTTKRIKAWAVLDTENGEIGSYAVKYREYMIGKKRIPQRHLHETYKSIPCTITYSLPQKKSSVKK